MIDGNSGLSRRAFISSATATGALAVVSSTAAAQESASTETEIVTVGPGGSLVFEPGTDSTMQITPGTTIEFVWDSDNHNIVVDTQPDGASWDGHETIENEGFTHSHTFETLGTYEYYCAPHQTAGMGATIEVVESISTPMPSNVPAVPDSAKTLGVATTFALIATLGMGFFFMKYGGDWDVEDN